MNFYHWHFGNGENARETYFYFIYNPVQFWSIFCKKACGTAIVCSHVLAEMDEWATDYAIIDRGEVLKAGENPSVVNSPVSSAKCFEVGFENPTAREQIESALKNAGLVPSQITVKGESLADIYRSIVQ